MKKLSLFILTCLLSITWAWADTSVTENYVTCTLTGAQTSRVSFNGKYSLWYYRNTRVLGSNDKLNDNTKGIWMSRASGNSCYIESTLEGGIKAVSFKWRQFSDGDNGFQFILNINVNGTNKKKISFTGADSYFNTDQSYSQTLAIKSNSKLTIQNSSTQSDGTTAGGRLIVGPITITPYLLYTQKVVTIGSKQQGYYNAELINNIGSEGTVSYSSSDENVARVNSETGVITPVAAGTTTITATWSEGAITTYTLHVVEGIIAENFSKVVQTGQTASATWHGDLFDWSVANVRRGVDDTIGLAPRIQATAMRTPAGSSLQSVNVMEGGVKHIAFDWRQWGSGSGTLNMNMYYSSDPANWGEAVATQSVEAVGASEPHVFDMDIDDGIKGHAYLKLQYTSDAGVAVMGAMKITPYLLYTNKSHALDTRVDELTYTNTGLIDNTSGDAVEYSINPVNAGATINSSTGEVTVTDETEGDFTVTATWGAVSTTYILTVMSRTATTASYAEAVKRVGLDALAIGNPLTYTDGYDGTISYSSSNTAVATVNENGTVSLAGGVGQTTITATLPQTENYKAATASFTLYVRDNNARIENFSNIPVGGGIIGDAGTDWEGVYFNWRAEGAIRHNATDTVWGTNNPDNVKVWIATKASNSSVTKTGVLSSKEAIEGGIKHLSFYWKQWASESNRILRVAAFAGETRIGFMEYTPVGASTHEKFLFGANDVMRGNQILSIKNESYTNGTFDGTIADDGNACRSRIIIDDIYITPYLLYINKAEQTVKVGATFKNTALINNTAGETGTLTYSSSNESVATVNGSGQVTGVGEGYAVITAKFAWSESEYVTTSYPIYVAPASNCETFNTACTDNFYATNNDVVGDVTTWSTVLGGINTNENVEPYAAFFRAKRDSEENFGSITSGTINGGISQLSFYWNIAVAEETDVNKWDIRVFINDREVKQLTNETGHELDGITGHQASMTKCTITDIDEPGNFVIRFENRTTMTDSYTSGNKGRFVIDNVFWESYDAPIFLDETADNTALIRRNSGATTDVNTNRSLVANVWNTLCMPFALSKSADLDNAEVQELSACTADGDALTVSFTAVTSDALVPGKPYLVKPTSDIPLTGFTDKQITIIPQAVNVGVITFQGIFSPTTLTGGDMNTLFVGTPNAARNNLFYPSTTSQLKGMRAYFKINTGSGAPLFRTARFVVEEKKLPTAVDDVRGQEVTVEKLIEDGHVIIIRDGKRYNVLGAQE